MKKIICVLLLVFLVLGLSSCNDVKDKAVESAKSAKILYKFSDNLKSDKEIVGTLNGEESVFELNSNERADLISMFGQLMATSAEGILDGSVKFSEKDGEVSIDSPVYDTFTVSEKELRLIGNGTDALLEIK